MGDCEIKWKTPEKHLDYVYNQKFRCIYSGKDFQKTSIEEQNKLASLYGNKTELEARIQGKRETLDKLKQEKKELWKRLKNSQGRILNENMNMLFKMILKDLFEVKKDLRGRRPVAARKYQRASTLMILIILKKRIDNCTK